MVVAARTASVSILNKLIYSYVEGSSTDCRSNVFARAQSYSQPGGKLLRMSMVRVGFVYIFLLIFLTSCKRPVPSVSSTPNPEPAAPPARQIQKIEACGLITKEEVGSVQSTAISDAKSSEVSDGVYLITQCYYASTGPNLSISLAVIQIDPKSPTGRSSRERWKQTFGRFDNAMNAEKKEEEEKGVGREEKEEKMAPPKKIEGVGEEAFWSGNRFGGALYVLKDDVFIRISVGGPDNEETKIEKSKTLAQKALCRLP